MNFQFFMVITSKGKVIIAKGKETLSILYGYYIPVNVHTSSAPTIILSILYGYYPDHQLALP